MTPHRTLLILALAAGLVPAPAPASQTLASELGCYNCHGDPPRRKAPSFAELARACASVAQDAAAQKKLADRLREGALFSHIDAHERLSPEVSAQLVRWICEGAR